MASSKERLRWDRMFGAQTTRMNRQRDMLTRAMALLTEANAALLEIANEPDVDLGGDNMRNRAQAAIARMAEMSASVGTAVEESDRQFDADMKEARDG